MSRAKHVSVVKSHRHLKLCTVTLTSPDELRVGVPDKSSAQACIQLLNVQNNNSNTSAGLIHDDQIIAVDGIPCLGLGATKVLKLIQLQTFPVELLVFRHPAASGSLIQQVSRSNQSRCAVAGHAYVMHEYNVFCCCDEMEWHELFVSFQRIPRHARVLSLCEISLSSFVMALLVCAKKKLRRSQTNSLPTR
jgi:hypothetical protein